MNKTIVIITLRHYNYIYNNFKNEKLKFFFILVANNGSTLVIDNRENKFKTCSFSSRTMAEQWIMESHDLQEPNIITASKINKDGVFIDVTIDFLYHEH